jgi:hypothetical protein
MRRSPPDYYERGVDMSKIPQGEWSAIAARYAKGESISRIAQSYGCTPPAIHYILKQSRRKAVENLAQSANDGSDSSPAPIRQSAQTPTASDIYHPTEPRGDAPVSMPDERTASLRGPGALQVVPHRAAATVSPVQPSRTQQHNTAGLDRELRDRAEAAIAAFRSSFVAALTESSPVAYQRLRQAASDLMRVAAQTTMVLDRLHASTERSTTQVRDHLRSTSARERV